MSIQPVASVHRSGLAERWRVAAAQGACIFLPRSEEHTSELQSHSDLVCRLLLEKKKRNRNNTRDALIRVRNIRAFNGRCNTSITHAYRIIISSKLHTLQDNTRGILTSYTPLTTC